MKRQGAQQVPRTPGGARERLSRAGLSWALTVAAVVGLWVTSSTEVAAAQSGWEVIDRTDGVVVSTRFVPQYELPIIRGVGMVEGNIYDVLAVLADVERNKEWMHSCRDSKLLKQQDDLVRIIYNRTATPWPVDDRDAVVKATIKPDMEKKTVTISFQSIKSPLMGEVEGVIRMPKLKGFYLLEKIDEGRTRVTYQAEADVGGIIPAWLAELNSKDIPLKTILSLRAQVKKTKGSYKDFLDKWDPKRGGQGF